MINNEFDFSNSFYGKVVKVYPETRELDVYLPELMQTLSGGSNYKSKIPTSENSMEFVSAIDFQNTVTIKNTIRTKPFNASNHLPSVDSDVAVIFIEEDPKRAYWESFNPNNTNGYALKEEEFPKLFETNINNVTIEISKKDTLKINLPERFNVLKRNNEFNISLESELPELVNDTFLNVDTNGKLNWQPLKNLDRWTKLYKHSYEIQYTEDDVTNKTNLWIITNKDTAYTAEELKTMMDSYNFISYGINNFASGSINSIKISNTDEVWKADLIICEYDSETHNFVCAELAYTFTNISNPTIEGI